MSGPPDIALFFGRLHPLLVHLPIGLIVLLALLELVARSPRFRQANANAGLILALTVPAALFTVLCGWLLSLGGGYEDRLLQWHKWTGIGTAAACLLAGLLYSLDLKKPYRWCLFASALVLVFASHLGGSLTHGSDYLVRYAPAPLRALLGRTGQPQPAETRPKDFTQLQAFAGVVQPVFQQNCTTCHGPEKSKAKLRLDSLAGVLRGGESGPAIVPGKSAESGLLKRLRLPISSDDHMPPDGKPQPSPDDIALIQWWVEAGAPANRTVGELNPPPQVTRILQARFGSPGSPAETTSARPLADVLPLAEALADELNIAVTALSPKEPWLQCNASVAGTNFGDAQLAKLAALGPNLRWLDLGGTGVTDAGLAQLAALTNLVRLHLERTAITEAGLTNVDGLGQLEYLNLYGTEITDAALESLGRLPKLKQVYLWQTKVTPAAAAAFADARTDKDQLERWADEIEQLKTKIREGHITVDVGTTVTSVPATNATPVNAECPVSGKPIDATKTALHEGKLIAFCCDDCKAKFQQDPKPFLEKLAAASASNAPPGGTKP